MGVGNYLVHVHKYIPQELRGAWISTVHNEYLLRLAETGIFGFLLYYMILIVALKKLWLGTRSANPWVFAVSIALCSYDWIYSKPLLVCLPLSSNLFALHCDPGISMSNGGY